MTDERHRQSGIIETLQSLVVAFALAMVFRGFVVEGFVIPTGSMAPTLLGQHLLMHSDQTGEDFPVGFDISRSVSPERFSDPLLGRSVPLSISEAKKIQPRGGDRVLVLKTLFPFFEPERFDVVVFKNPTDTQGASANYIKRLIGLPGETLWIADGDIFTKKGNTPFLIQRKPEHIQRSLWRPVSNSDAVPTDALALTRPWRGPPWRGRPSSAWSFENRTWSCKTPTPSSLEWDLNRMLIDDWLPYNMLMPTLRNEPMSDVRVSATIIPETLNLVADFSLEALGHNFIWSLESGVVSLSMYTKNGEEVSSVESNYELFEANMPTRVEFWHVDQMMSLYINGERVIELLYDFGPEKRLRLATGSDQSVLIEDIAGRGGKQPKLSWHFEGSPLSIKRLDVDHDLYYRSSRLPSRATKNPTKEGNEKLVEVGSPAFGTHPDKLAVLGEDQFLMAGDNSAYSLDGRLWGNPDLFVATQIDDTPFVVNRDLLIGKAWSVYWPSGYRLGFAPIIPDFGRIRFIR
ncbi:MAG: S26 family signal peptidase [Phycisphaerales bacterium]|jgi:signal peptidase I|nr:S26 family signal peptidase [Phycisphaerales bacterium]